jgi:hypothetical protein
MKKKTKHGREFVPRNKDKRMLKGVMSICEEEKFLFINDGVFIKEDDYTLVCLDSLEHITKTDSLKVTIEIMKIKTTAESVGLTFIDKRKHFSN